jgi:hypothetical protein
MSRIDKLKTLLARVEQRRAEPRLVAVSGGHAVSSANTNLATPQPTLRAQTPLELAPRPAATPALVPPAPTPPAPTSPAPTPSVPASFEEAFASSAPSSIPPPSFHEAQSRQLSSLPPPPTLPPSGPSSTVPPSALPTGTQARSADRPAARSTTEVLPAAPSRIGPSPALPFDSAVRVTSSPRLDVPKTFGELLEQSLALRPKSG